MAIDIPGVPALQRFARLRDELFVHHKDKFGGAVALALMNGKRQSTDTLVACTQLALLEYEFPAFLIVLMEDKVVFVGSSKKLAYLEGIKTAAEEMASGKLPTMHSGDPAGHKALQRAPLAVEFVVRPKKSDDASLFEPLVASIKAKSSSGSSGPKVAVVKKEPGEGDFAVAWNVAMDKGGVDRADAEAGLLQSLITKDRRAGEELARAAQLTVAITRKRFLTAFMDAVEENELPGHRELCAKVDAATEEDPKSLSSSLSKHTPEYCDVAMHACVQSGGRYSVDLRNATPNDEKLAPDTVIFSFGGRYRSYGALLARTYLINPTKSQTLIYRSLLEAHGVLLEGLREGVVIGDVVKQARDILTKAAPGAVIPESLGSGIGVLNDESPLALREDNRMKLPAGVCLAVITAVKDATNTDATSGAKGNAGMARFSFALADTVFVLEAGGPQPNMVLTKKSKKELGDIRFTLDEDEADDEEEDDDDEDEEEDEDEQASSSSSSSSSSSAAAAGGRDVRRSSRIQAVQGDTEARAEEQKRREKQLRKIFMAQITEARKALEKATGTEAKETAKEKAVRKARPIEAYTSPLEFPATAAPNRISVDREKQCVLVPMYGQLVPFSISTIRSVVKSDEGGRTFLRFNFYAPGSSAGKDCPPAMVAAMEKHPHHAYVKTLNFQSRDGRNIAHVTRLIKEMQKKSKAEFMHKQERSNLVKQPKLMINRVGRVPRLQQLHMYPRISGKKSTGALEAHHNGLRFRSDRGEIVDIIYDNMQHAIFQPCLRDLHVIIHFHLHNPIMVGKKKHRDIKFFAEVVDSTQNLDGMRRSMYDPDELGEEQRERQLRRQLNNAFKSFVQKVEAVAQAEPAATSLEFDAPSRDLSFMGRAQKEMVEISPCRDCLVALSDTPPWVLTLDDIEHVHFERVIYGSKNFDISFVIKPDVLQPGDEEVRQVSMVPMNNLETIQNWLVDVVERPYTQGVRSLAWKSFLAGFVRQPDFYASRDEDGNPKPVGWMLLADGGSGDEEDAEGGGDGDEEFQAESSDEEEDDDAEFDEAVDDEDDEEEDDEDEFEEEDEVEEAADWEDLERQAKEDDLRAEAMDRERSRRDTQTDGKRPRADGGKPGKKAKHR